MCELVALTRCCKLVSFLHLICIEFYARVNAIIYRFVTMIFVRYTQTAASLKDVVILLDLSGNVKESSIETAKETARKIIETLGDDDYFNVIKVSKLQLTEIICTWTMSQSSK